MSDAQEIKTQIEEREREEARAFKEKHADRWISVGIPLTDYKPKEGSRVCHVYAKGYYYVNAARVSECTLERNMVLVHTSQIRKFLVPVRRYDASKFGHLIDLRFDKEMPSLYSLERIRDAW